MRTNRSRIAAMVLGTALVVAVLFLSGTAAAESQGETLQSQENTTGDACTGTPQMSQQSITSPQNRITADQPGVVEANFRLDPTLPENCQVVVDLEFSFSDSGFQFGGGAEWQQATTDLVATQFTVSAGEIRDIRAEIQANGAEAGDDVTVIADYEIWYEGDRENSVQQSGIRHTLEVEEEEPDDANGPGFGIFAAISGLLGAGLLAGRRLR